MHDSGLTHTSGRRDLRRAMVNAANRAVQHHVHWKSELERPQPRLGRSKAVVAIARKLLVAIWHVLTQNVADRFADPSAVARSFYDHAYSIGRKNLPEGQPVMTFIRTQMDQLDIGKDLQEFPWGGRLRKMPPSKMFEQTK